jgi:catechol 2,3-dioxygenase-like lactoylglutathione lyase family enzyme
VQLNHLDVQVPNVLETAAFFERHFQFEIHGNRLSPAIAILEGQGGFILVLQRVPDAAYPEGFHIGFLVAHEAEVHEKHASLAAAGVACGEVQRNGRGVMFYFKAPGGVLVEVSHRPRPLPPVRAGA